MAEAISQYGEPYTRGALMPRITESALQRIEQQEEKEKEESASPAITGVAGYVMKAWEAAKRAKVPIQDRLLQNLRQRKGEYNQQDLRDIEEQGGADIFMKLTGVKCRAAKAWIRDILLPAGDKPWGIEPTPLPDLPPQLSQICEQIAQQEVAQGLLAPSPDDVLARINDLQDTFKEKLLSVAKQAAERMEDLVQDQLVDADWTEVLSEILDDLVTFPAAIVAVPVVRNQDKFNWVQQDGRYVPSVESKPTVLVERVSPFDIYPAPKVRNFKDGYCLRIHHLTMRGLQEMIGIPGYDDGAINRVLTYYGTPAAQRNWLHLWDEREREFLEDRDYAWADPEGWIYALEFWGDIPGDLLRDWGMSQDKVPDLARVYANNTWIINNEVIKCTLNEHPLAEKPFRKTSWEKVPGSFWGESLPELMEDIQRICNATARAVVNNLSIASGPQVGINTWNLDPGVDPTDLYPWKVWAWNYDPSGHRGAMKPPIDFFQPNPITQALMGVFEFFSKLADDYTGIPAYAYGSPQVSGAGKTASGLAMLMNSALRGMKQVIFHLDELVKQVIQSFVFWNMLYHDDEAVKGDLEVQARGASQLFIKELSQVRRAEFLEMTSKSPIDMQIMGVRGRAEILREVAKTLDMDVDKIIPEEGEAENQQLLMGLQKISEAFGIPLPQIIQVLQAPPAEARGGPSGRSQLPPERGPGGGPYGGTENRLMPG